MYHNKIWYLLKPFKKSKELDVTLLRKLIINKILRNKKNINFVSGFKGKKALENLIIRYEGSVYLLSVAEETPPPIHLTPIVATLSHYRSYL